MFQDKKFPSKDREYSNRQFEYNFKSNIVVKDTKGNAMLCEPSHQRAEGLKFHK